MPITKRLYEKVSGILNIPSSILPSLSPTPTPSITPSVTATPSITPTISITPSITPTISITPTPTPSSAYYYLANIYGCNGTSCGFYLGQTSVYSYTSLLLGYFYSNSGITTRVYQIVSPINNPINPITINSSESAQCSDACGSIIPPSPSVTPSTSIPGNFSGIIFWGEDSGTACGEFLPIEVIGDGATFCESNNFTSVEFSTMGDGGIFITNGGLLKTVNVESGSPIATFNGGCDPCP